MSEQRTPPTGAIRRAWIEAHPFRATTPNEERDDEFDRWLAAHDAELRAEVERLRTDLDFERGQCARLAGLADKAERQVADLRAFASWLVSLDDDNPDSPGRQERRTVTLSQIIDRALNALAGSGEQPGERDATPDEAHDIGYSKGHADGYREAMAEHRPAPASSDSADVREQVAVEVPEQIARYVEATAEALNPSGYKAGIASAVRLIRRWRPEYTADRIEKEDA